MVIRFYGHSLFTFELDSGRTILTDPYGVFYDYPVQTIAADVVTISHHHHDHDAVSMVGGTPVIVDRVGVHTPFPGLRITGIPTKHDEVGGAKRGDNIVFIIEAEGLRIVHLGDLGHLLTDEQSAAIGTPDVLLTPVGGTYTTDAQTAAANVHRLQARVTIPMHYQTSYSQAMSITTEKPFLLCMKSDAAAMPLCRITAGDILQRPPVLLLSVTAVAVTP